MTRTTFATCLVAALTSAAILPQAAAAADPPVRTAANDVSPIVGEYRLGAGDKLRIEVYKDTQLSQSLQVRPDGKITLPLVGDHDANKPAPRSSARRQHDAAGVHDQPGSRHRTGRGSRRSTSRRGLEVGAVADARPLTSSSDRRGRRPNEFANRGCPHRARGGRVGNDRFNYQDPTEKSART